MIVVRLQNILRKNYASLTTCNSDKFLNSEAYRFFFYNNSSVVHIFHLKSTSTTIDTAVYFHDAMNIFQISNRQLYIYNFLSNIDFTILSINLNVKIRQPFGCFVQRCKMSV